MRVLSALLLSSLWAQGVSLGLRSGVNITPQLAADGPQQASASRFTIGPLIEVHLWRGTAIGGDFLLRRSQLGFSSAGSRRAEVPLPFTPGWDLAGVLDRWGWRVRMEIAESMQLVFFEVLE